MSLMRLMTPAIKDFMSFSFSSGFAATPPSVPSRRPSFFAMEILKCIPFPGFPGSGFGEKSAQQPLLTATFWITQRRVAVLSAVVSGSA